MHTKNDGLMLLNLQMLLDPMDELLWNYTAHLPEEPPRFRSCQIYCGQTELSPDMLYLFSGEWGADFPVDRYASITT